MSRRRRSIVTSLEPAGRPIVRSGVVKLDGRVLADDGGPFLDFCVSFLAAAWAYRHDRPRFDRALDFLAGEGVTSIRALGTAGPAAWSDRTIDPRWSDYDAVIAGVTDACSLRGMRIEWTIFGGISTTPTAADRMMLIHRFIGMARGREATIRNWEVANEAWQNGFEGVAGRDEMWRLAARLRERTPHPVALTAPVDGWVHPETGETLPAGAPGAVLSATWWYRGSPATLATMHLDRSTSGSGGLFRPMRQTWEPQHIDGLPRAWVNNEPIGPQSSGEADDDPLRLVMSAALTYLCGGASYTLHTGPGVRFGGVEDLARGRVANFEDVAHIRETCAGIRRVLALLPADLPNWTRHNARTAAFPDHPFASPQLEALVVSEDVVRWFAATSPDGRTHVSMPIGIRRTTGAPIRHATQLEIIHPLAGERTVELAAGEALILRPDVPALILKGQWR